MFLVPLRGRLILNSVRVEATKSEAAMESPRTGSQAPELVRFLQRFFARTGSICACTVACSRFVLLHRASCKHTQT